VQLLRRLVHRAIRIGSNLLDQGDNRPSHSSIAMRVYAVTKARPSEVATKPFSTVASGSVSATAGTGNPSVRGAPSKKNDTGTLRILHSAADGSR
jgi:hypothetical protein